MKLIIDIHEDEYEVIRQFQSVALNKIHALAMSIINGTPLDTHDEEIIATTVESIWGKPPYTELLDKIRGELHSEITLLETGQTGNKLVAYGMKQALEVIDKYIEMGCRGIPQTDCNTCDKAVLICSKR